MPDQLNGSSSDNMPSTDLNTMNRDQLAAQVEHLLTVVADLQHKLDHTNPEKSGADIQFRDTLLRLVSRIAMILQAEKCVVMLFNHQTAELCALSPAFGFTQQETELFRMPASIGMSGLVFLTGQPIAYNEPKNDLRMDSTLVTALNIQNGCCAALVVQRRDLSNQVVDSYTLGVVHVMNKRYGLSFNEEDLRLMERLSRNAAAVITSARMYQEAAEDHKELISTFESLGAGLILVNANKHITLVNSQAESIMPGLQQAALNKEDYHTALTQLELVNLFDIALTTRKEGSIEITTIDDRIYQVSVTPVKTEDGLSSTGAVAIFNDITDIRALDRMKNSFVSTVSHELRTPLTSIQGFVTTLLNDTDGYYDDTARKEFLGIIDQEAERLRRLIDDLLSMTRVEAGRPLELHLQWMDVVPIINKVVAFEQAVSPQHSIEQSVPTDMPNVYADPDKIEQILCNLINNAVKYQPNGGPIQVTLTCEQSLGSYSIQVTDHGVGIPADQLSMIFNKFHRVQSGNNAQISGTGIGLFLVKHLTAAHGGEVTVSSILAEGSSFTVKLPLRAVLCPIDMNTL